MEWQSQKTDCLFRRCLLISLGLHLGLAGLGVMAGWGRMLPAPVVIQVSLVSGPAGEPGKAAAAAPRGGPVQAMAARAARPRRAPKARKERRPPPTARPTPAPAGLALESAPLTLSSLPRARGLTSPGGLPGGRDQTGGPGGGEGTGAGPGGGPGSGGVGAASAQSRYFSLVRARILAQRHYPLLARRRQQQGTVRVRFSLSAAGHLCQEVRVVRPSGFSLLDEQARQCVAAAAPFPPFPPELRRDHLTIEVPIIYRLTDGGI